jgi:hypothetical protein
MPTTTHIDESLMQLLSADAAVYSIVGSRLYAVQAPQGTALPCIVYQRENLSRGPYMHMGGMTGITRVTFSVSAIGESLLAVRNLARAIRTALQFKRTDSIRLAVVKDDDDAQEPPANGEQLPIYRTDVSVEITYTES